MCPTSRQTQWRELGAAQAIQKAIDDYANWEQATGNIF
jgi:hypothetical protein